MTKEEVISYIKQKKNIEHEISGIYKHTELSWIQDSGLNVFTAMFFDNSMGKENNFIVSSGAGDYSRKCAIGRQRQKTYKLNKLTPKLLDEIVDEVMPKMYGEVEKAIKLYKEKKKLKEIEKDFE
ncbi:MAG: hypothetical protein J6T74_01925 [Clostridia bacterium]|nr:hypothetical protein [Clostridia bacterium]